MSSDFGDLFFIEQRDSTPPEIPLEMKLVLCVYLFGPACFGKLRSKNCAVSNKTINATRVALFFFGLLSSAAAHLFGPNLFGRKGAW